MVDVEVGEELRKAPDPAPRLAGELAVDGKSVHEGTCPPGNQIPQIRNDRRATAFPITDEQAHPELVVRA